MSDVVRLSIVYDTQQAAARLNNLNGQLGNVHGSSRKAANAAVSLAQAFSTGNISAIGLTHSLSGLGGRLGVLGLGLATAAGLLLTFRNIADKARETAHKLEDQLRTVTRAVDELLRGDIRSPLQTQIENITDAIRELDRTIAVQRMGLLERLGIKPTFKRGRDDVISQAILRFFGGGADPALVKQRGALTGQLNRLKPEELSSAISSRAFNEANRISQFNVLTRGMISDDAAEKVKLLSGELKDLLQILPPESDAVQSVAKSFRDAEDTARRLVRAEALMQNGLGEMAAALEDFVVTGTIAFTDFLNNILRLLYRDFTGELIHGLVRSVYGGNPSAIPGGGGGGGTQVLGDPTGGGPGINASITAAPVNFNISTMDAQGVAQFINTHGAAIAAEVTRQAGRSAGLRRAFRRG